MIIILENNSIYLSPQINHQQKQCYVSWVMLMVFNFNYLYPWDYAPYSTGSSGYFYLSNIVQKRCNRSREALEILNFDLQFWLWIWWRISHRNVFDGHRHIRIIIKYKFNKFCHCFMVTNSGSRLVVKQNNRITTQICISSHWYNNMKLLR